jgi:hypothetical protein
MHSRIISEAIFGKNRGRLREKIKKLKHLLKLKA